MIAWTGIEHFRMGRYDPPPPACEPEDAMVRLFCFRLITALQSSTYWICVNYHFLTPVEDMSYQTTKHTYLIALLNVLEIVSSVVSDPMLRTCLISSYCLKSLSWWISLICDQDGRWVKSMLKEEAKLDRWKQPGFIHHLPLLFKHLLNNSRSDTTVLWDEVVFSFLLSSQR